MESRHPDYEPDLSFKKAKVERGAVSCAEEQKAFLLMKVKTTTGRARKSAQAASKAETTAPSLQVRLRVRHGRDIAFGPGKGDLLKAIDEAGSLLAAARRLKMSYMRAWSLVQEMHRCFRSPLVALNRGGTNRGGAKLTEPGQEVLRLYMEMEETAQTATAANWRKLRRQLRG